MALITNMTFLPLSPEIGNAAASVSTPLSPVDSSVSLTEKTSRSGSTESAALSVSSVSKKYLRLGHHGQTLGTSDIVEVEE